MTPLIFDEFSSADKEAWKSQAIRDLKGKDFDQSLKSKLWDKIELEPFYTKEDLVGLPQFPPNCFEKANDLPGFPARTWVNYVSIYPNTTNAQVLEALAKGATGLIIQIGGDENLEAQLKGVQAEFISILIQPMGAPMGALQSFLTWIETQSVDPSRLSGGLLWSPMDRVFEGKSLEDAMNLCQQIVGSSPKSASFCPFLLNFSRYAETGASGLDELIFGFGELIELLDQCGMAAQRIFERLGIFTAVGSPHFPEIAKLKSIRFFAVELALQYGVDLRPESVFIFAKTSHWTKSTLDANTNLIRQTYEAMAVILGGANGLLVSPLQDQVAGELESRIARNVSSILTHESYLDQVVDPAAGSYYLESLTAQILGKVRAGIENQEENGGWKAAFDSSQIHEKLRYSRTQQQQAVASGENPKIGVNKYPASSKLRYDLPFTPIEEESKQLKSSRASYLVELQKQKEA